jgi:hypothetical protein
VKAAAAALIGELQAKGLPLFEPA